jgi:putative membrane protein
MKKINLMLLFGISAVAMNMFAQDNTTNQALMSISSQDFVTEAVWAGEKEAALGQMALDKSQDASVTNFAAQMVRDHTRANERLIRIADQKGLSYPPTNSFVPEKWIGLDTEDFKGMGAEALVQNDTGTNADLKMAKYLDSLSGASFDQAYAACAVQDHTNAVELFSGASQTLQDKQLKRFATRTLPVLKDHYQMAVDMQNEVSTNSVGTSTMR